MNPKHLALVLLVASGTVVAGIGLVSGGHKPTNPDDVYIHEVDQVIQDNGGCVMVEDTDVENLNKVTILGWTNHFNTTFYHDDGQEDVRVHVPELRVPVGHKIVLFSNEENPTIESLANGPLEGSCAEVSVTGTIVIGEYNINVGHIKLPQGAEVVAGSDVGDNAPAPGDGNPSVSTASGLGVLSGSSTNQSSTAESD